MNILFKRDVKQGDRFLLECGCAYCGDLCEDEFCCEAHEYLFYGEEELGRDEELEYDEEREELDLLIREEMKTRTGEIPTFEGERP